MEGVKTRGWVPRDKRMCAVDIVTSCQAVANAHAVSQSWLHHAVLGCKRVRLACVLITTICTATSVTDTFLASFKKLWEIEMETIQMSTRSTNGGSSLLGTKMQGPMRRVLNVPLNLMEALWRNNDGINRTQQQSIWPCKFFDSRQTTGT
jgi:hypothetical protein